MTKSKQPNNTTEPRQRKHCYYQNGKRSFSGTPKEVAGYARRDQYLQWAVLILWLVIIVLSFLYSMPQYVATGIGFLKKYLP